MIKIDETLVQNLKNGDFSRNKVNKWFKNYLFKYILAIITGCDKKIDYDMLNFISIYSQKLLVNPNAQKFSKRHLKKFIVNTFGIIPANLDTMSHKDLIDYCNSKIISYCEKILEQVIIVSNKHSEYFTILNNLYNCDNDAVRLYCCANADYNKFLNDHCPRVKKVANIRRDFALKWTNYDEGDLDKKRIKFLTAAIEEDIIECWDGCVYYKEEDKTFAMLHSNLFETYEIWFPEFDSDIYYTIKDKRVLASVLNDFIKNGQILLKDSMVPEYFKVGSIKKKVKTY